MYVYGRDRNFRPIINIRPRIIANFNVELSYLTHFIQPKIEAEDAITACTFMMEYVRENFFLPGQIENWVIVMDLE